MEFSCNFPRKSTIGTRKNHFKWNPILNSRIHGITFFGCGHPNSNSAILIGQIPWQGIKIKTANEKILPPTPLLHGIYGSNFQSILLHLAIKLVYLKKQRRGKAGQTRKKLVLSDHLNISIVTKNNLRLLKRTDFKYEVRKIFISMKFNKKYLIA